ncbi:YadA-like family protein, partial [Vibrio europaeus]
AGEYTGYTVDTSNGRVEDKFGKLIGHMDANGNIKPVNNNNGNNSSDLNPSRRDNTNRNNDQNNAEVDKARSEAKAKGLEQAIDYAIDKNQAIEINGKTYGTADLIDAKNTLASMSKEDRAALVKELEKPQNNQIDIKVKDAENGGSNDVIDETSEIMNAVDEAAAQYNADVNAANAWATQAEAQFKQEVARLDSKIDTMEGRVSNGTAMVGAMSQMQFGRDGLGLGAGVAEFNGSKAVAVGVGYAFGAEKEWMAKGSFGYAESKKGRGSKDTMAAAGLTYSFK